MHRFEIISALYYRPVNIRTITDMDISCKDTRIYTNWSEMSAYLPRQSHQKSAKNKQYYNCFIEYRNNQDKNGSRLAGKLDYLLLVYLVTALVPSDTACLASSPGRRSLTEVWISLEVMVDLLL